MHLALNYQPLSSPRLVANIMANLIAFMAFLAFVDSMIGWVGDMIDIPQLSFKASSCQYTVSQFHQPN